MIEHCISALKLNNEKQSYQIYVTEALKAIAENTTHFLGMDGIVDHGKTLSKSWYDIVTAKPKEEKPEDNRSCEEITADIFKGIRGH